MQPARPSPQQQLFPETGACVMYEQPLNERIRCFLRLEYLFQSVAECMQGKTALNARQAVASLIDITDQLSRADIKGDLIKELERHAATLSALRSNPAVNQTTLDNTLSRLDPILSALRSPACQPGQRMRQMELVTQVRQRLAIPGGLCSFDLPAFHFWLSREHVVRVAQLNDWMDDLRVIEEGVEITLKLIRESAVPQKVAASGGFYQQNLDPTSSCTLVRVVLNVEEEVFAEISGGKHRFTVRFIRPADPGSRPQQTSETVHFELQCCGL